MADTDKVLAEMGSAIPGGSSASTRREGAAAMIWLRAHKTDTEEAFDALPVKCQRTLRSVYAVPAIEGLHWSKVLARMLKAFAECASPVKEGPKADDEVALSDQRRPQDDAANVQAARARAQAEARLMEDNELLAFAAKASKRQKDVTALSPESLKEAATAAKKAGGAAGAGKTSGKTKWLTREELERDIPDAILVTLMMTKDMSRSELAKALKGGDRGGTLYELTVQPLFTHRASFAMGKAGHDAMDLNLVGKLLAHATMICVDHNEDDLAKMLTEQVKKLWEKALGHLRGPRQVPESELKGCFSCIDGMFVKREGKLKVLLVDCGEGGEEVMRAAARQTIQVAKLWDWVAVNIANDRLTSPGRSTANAVWMTVIGRAMDQRAGLALSGAHTLTDALARLGAVDPVRRQLAPALALQAAPAQLAHGAAYTLAAEAAQPTYAAMYTLGAQHAVDTGPQHAGWALTPAWGAPPPPAYVSPWGAQQQPAYPQQAAQAYVSPGQQPETEVHMDLGGGLAGEP